MAGTTGTLLLVAVAVIALVQVGLLIAALVAGRRLLRELVPLLSALTEAVGHLQTTVDQVGTLVQDTDATVQQARRTAAQVGAIAGAGRSLLEGAIGSAIARRIVPGVAAAGVASGGTLSAVRTGIQVATALYRVIGRRRQRAREMREATGITQAAAAAPGSEGQPPVRRMGIGAVRRVPPEGQAPTQG